MVAEEYTTEVQGLPTRYLTAGTTGPPLVLLHGVGANAFDWQWVMPALAGITASTRRTCPAPVVA